MSNLKPAPAPAPVSSTSLATVQGIIDVVFASFGALQGQGDGRVWRPHGAPHAVAGSEEELAWSQACAWTCERMMAGAMMREALRGGSN
jgi:hypothetical protein